MGKSRHRSFSELVRQNKSQILRDQEIMEKIERKIEEKQIKKTE